MKLPKYVRIQGREIAWKTKKPVGIFILNWRRIRDNIYSPEDVKLYDETHQWFLSSAKNKQSWGWTHLKNCVEQHYKSRESKYGFFMVDIFTSVLTGILTKKQYYQRKKNSDDLSFLQEYLNIWLGNNEDGIFKYEDFETIEISKIKEYQTSSKEEVFLYAEILTCVLIYGIIKLNMPP